MTLARDKTQALPEAAGFELQPGSGLGIGDTFHCRLDDEWFVQATGLYVHPDGGTIDETRYRFMHLAERTRHAARFCDRRGAGETPGCCNEGDAGGRRTSQAHPLPQVQGTDGPGPGTQRVVDQTIPALSVL